MVARLVADDDSIDRWVVCRYVPAARDQPPPEMEDLDAFDSLDEADALREALLFTRLGDGRKAGAPRYEYTIRAVEAGTLRRDRNLQAVTQAREAGEDFERLPEYQDLPRSVAFTLWRTEPERRCEWPECGSTSLPAHKYCDDHAQEFMLKGPYMIQRRCEWSQCSLMALPRLRYCNDHAEEHMRRGPVQRRAK
jgi:hypothetical protein